MNYTLAQHSDPLDHPQSTIEDDSSIQGTTPLSGVAQNLQAFLSNSFTTSNQHYPPTTNISTANFTSFIGDQQPHSYQQQNQNDSNRRRPPIQVQKNQDRSQSQKPPMAHQSNKQVRFDIKEGLKNLIDQSNLDVESIASRSQSVASGQCKPMKRVQSTSSMERKSKSPQSAKSNRSQKDQQVVEVKKNGSYKQRKLALKYKREADQNRRKKQGEPTDNQPNDDLYTNLLQHTQSQDFLEEPPSPERIQAPPKPSEIKPTKIEAIRLEYGNKNINQKHDNIVHMSVDNLPRQITQQLVSQEKTAGMIVRNQPKAVDISAPIIRQPGIIVRQRSTSPGDALSLGRNKENQSLLLNQSMLAGQIIKIQKQQPNLNHTQPLIQPVTIQQITSPIRNLPPQQQIISPRIQPVIKKVIQVQQKPSFPFKTLWALLSARESSTNLQILNSQDTNKLVAHTRQQLLEELSNQTSSPFGLSLHAQQSNKLKSLRQKLNLLALAQHFNQLTEILRLIERRQVKSIQLKQALKKSVKNDTQDLLRVELIKDIISRLNQKIILRVLLINSQIKRTVSELFTIYYEEYIGRVYKETALKQLEKYRCKQQAKKEYLFQLRDQVCKVKTQQVFYAWKNIKVYRHHLDLKNDEARQLLLSRKLTRFLAQWKITIISERNIQLGQQLAQDRQKLKYQQQLFMKWIFYHRSQNKIKRKALKQLYQPESNSSLLSLNDEQWLKQQLKQSEEKFYSKIQEILLEREHNKNFIASLKFKNTIEELNQAYPLQFSQTMDGVKRQDLTMARQNNERRIYLQYPELRFKRGQRDLNPQRVQSQVRSSQVYESNTDLSIEPQKVRQSLDIDLKYQIHHAFACQQNEQKLRQSHSFVQKSESKPQLQHSAQTPKRLMPPAPQRLVDIERSANKIVVHQVQAPNALFQKLENQIALVNPKPIKQSFTFDRHSLLPLDLQLKQHILSLQRKINQLQNLDCNHHFTVSLKAHAKHVTNQEAFTGVTDYIQYGLANQSSRVGFIQMHHTKVQSRLFTQWKARFLKRQLQHTLPEIHTLQTSKTSLKNWLQVVERKKIQVKEYLRTKELQRHYQVFKKWARWNRERVMDDRDIVRTFRRRQVFKNWVKYLHTQGDQLLRILRSQQYYHQALLSKSLLSLYHHYLKQLRIRRFQRSIVLKKFFKCKWKTRFLQNRALKALLSKIENKVQMQDRLKYQREYEIKSHVLHQWSKRVADTNKIQNQFKAMKHYKQQLLVQTFYNWKRQFSIYQGLKKLSSIPLKAVLQPTFNLLHLHSLKLLHSQKRFQNYRQNYSLTKAFMNWKEYFMKRKLSKMFYKRKILRTLQTYVRWRNYTLPEEYRERKMQLEFFVVMKAMLGAKWRQHRSGIMERQLHRKRQQKIQRMVLLRLMQNALQNRHRQMVESTVNDFRQHCLYEKGFKALKKRMLIRQRARLLKRVAREFYMKIHKRRQLRAQAQGAVAMHNPYGEDDSRHRKFRIYNAWRMYSDTRFRLRLILDRFLGYKHRLMLLRYVLGWKQVVKYDQSMPSTSRSGGQNLKWQMPRQMHESRQMSKLPERIHSDQSELKHTANFQEQASFMQQNRQQTDQKFKQVIGSPDITQVLPPMACGSPFALNKSPQNQMEHSLFDELETIFHKNRKWLDEQREREDFLREMAQHYNQRLSNEMSTLMYSTEKFKSLESQGRLQSIAQRQHQEGDK